MSIQRSIAFLRRYDRPFRKSLRIGLIATLGVVILRLALPWPLKYAMELLIEERSVTPSIPDAWVMKLIPITLAFLVLAGLLAIAEMTQRVYLKKYAVSTVHSLRQNILDSFLSVGRKITAPDLVSRLVGDAARVKSEISGIVLHGTQNGLMYSFITCFFLYLSLPIGAIFMLGGILTTLFALWTKEQITGLALKQRKKEAAYANVISQQYEFSSELKLSNSANTVSGDSDVKTTKKVVRCMTVTHIIMSITIALSIWMAFSGSSTALSAGSFFLLMAYSLTMHRRMILFARQIARSGKTVANVYRLEQILGDREIGETISLNGLNGSLHFHKIRMDSEHGAFSNNNIRIADFELQPGDKIAFIGAPSEEKSRVFQILAGQVNGSKSITWNGQTIKPAALFNSQSVAYIPEFVTFSRSKISHVLGLSAGEEIDKELVRMLGLKRVIFQSRKGLATKIDSSMVSRHEARAMYLYRLINAPDPQIWLIDGVDYGLTTKKTKSLVDLLIKQSKDKTVVLGLSYPTYNPLLTQVYRLKKGKIHSLKFE